MKKIGLILAFLSSLAFADLSQMAVTPEFVKSGVKIIDIRTKGEWVETGIVENSIPITFFDEQGRYNAEAFIQELNKYVKKDREFALICRTGNRTTAVSDFLSKQGYKVINLKGGVKKLMAQGYTLEPYNSK